MRPRYSFVFDIMHTVLQTGSGGEGEDLLCFYLIILGIIVLALYIGLQIYIKMFANRGPKEHPCRYCGHIVETVSDCCQAPVIERFGGGKCMKCGKETKIVCARCRRPIH